MVRRTSLEDKIDRLRGLLEATPDNTMTALALAEAHRSQGQHLEALVVYQEIASRCRLADVHLALAEIYAQHGHSRQALAELEKLLVLDPNSVQARLVFEELKMLSVPRELVAKLAPTPALEAVLDARQRMLVERSLCRMELAELQRRAALDPNQPELRYFALEAEKRLHRLENRLQCLEMLQARVANTARLDTYVETLARVRGISTVTIVSRYDGVLQHRTNGPNVPPEQLKNWVLEALDLLDAYPARAKSWALECRGGVAVIEVLDSRLALMVTGEAGLNFGSLRFTLEKARAELQVALAG